MSISYEALTEESEFDTYWYDERGNYRDKQTITWSALQTPYEYSKITTINLLDGTSSETSYRTAGHGEVELSFIRAIFRELDRLIEPGFVEAPSADADIVIISSLDDIYVDGMGAAGGYFSVAKSVAPASRPESQKIGYVAWRDYTGVGHLSEWEMSTIVHEIGHALRLSHPGAGGVGGASGGYNPEWNQKDSVMSYNPYEGRESLFFRELDIKALQSFWGEELNPSSLAGWPATEGIPSKISSLDKPLSSQETIVNENDSGLVIEQINSDLVNTQKQQLIDEITNYPWQQEVASKIGGDSVMDIYIDQRGKARLSKEMRSAAKLGRMSSAEVQFIRDIASEIDSASALDLNFVAKPAMADVIISGAKKMPNYNAYYDWGNDVYHLAWSNRNKKLTPSDQVFVTASLMASAGLKESVDSSLSTFDTVMSWNGRNFYGLTEADKTALTGLWGEA